MSFTQDQAPHGNKPLPLHKQLQLAREKSNVTQEQLAERSGVARPTIYRCESGKFDPRVSTIAELARALGLELMLVPRSLVGELTAFVQSEGKLLGQPAGAEAPPSGLEQWSRGLSADIKKGKE